MYQVKIFHDSFITLGDLQSADEHFNAWIKDHRDIEIIDFRYQQGRHGDHSIAILYNDPKKEEE